MKHARTHAAAESVPAADAVVVIGVADTDLVLTTSIAHEFGLDVVHALDVPDALERYRDAWFRLALISARVCEGVDAVATLRQAGVAARVAIFVGKADTDPVRAAVRRCGEWPIDRDSAFCREALVAALGVSPARSVLRWGPLELDREAGKVRIDGRKVSLTDTETRMLALLIEACGALVTVATLHRLVHGGVVCRTAVSMHAGALNRKLGMASPIVVNVRGRGYCVVLPGEAA